MSAPVVSYEVWNNGRLAASRFHALATRALVLCEELSKVAELWQRARDQHGEQFPAWSYGDSELPASIRDLAERVAKVQETQYQGIRGKRPRTGLSGREWTRGRTGRKS